MCSALFAIATVRETAYYIRFHYFSYTRLLYYIRVYWCYNRGEQRQLQKFHPEESTIGIERDNTAEKWKKEWTQNHIRSIDMHLHYSFYAEKKIGFLLKKCHHVSTRHLWTYVWTLNFSSICHSQVGMYSKNPEAVKTYIPCGIRDCTEGHVSGMYIVHNTHALKIRRWTL